MMLLGASLAILLLGALGVVASTSQSRAPSVVGMATAATGCAVGFFYALRALLRGSVESATLPWAIPNGALSFGIDPLSAFFLVPLFAIGGLAAIYGHQYLSEYATQRSLAPVWAAYNTLVASMVLVVIARHAVLFLVGWEIMSVTAYLLVTFEHEDAAVRRAGWVLLVATHVGVALLIGMFLLLGRHAGSFEFAAMLAAGPPEPRLGAALFLLAVFGFGVKAGFVPVHGWLPEAHAAAPSHVSAVMSGVLIKTGLYGLLRVLVLLGGAQPWWGPLLMGIGVGGAVLGISLALYQRDIKRVLAYSSIENVGLITLGVGVGLWGATLGQPVVATLGLASGLFHIWNHSVMKGLMFLGAGSVVRGSGAKDLERLGGLLRRMPRTATALVVGAIAIAGLPPLNGFVSEWLLYSGLLEGALATEGPGAVAMLVTIAAVSMVGAMAALCFARLVSIALLGVPRSPRAEQARESPPWMLVPLAVLCLSAIGLALAPGVVFQPVNGVVAELLGPSASRVPTSALGLTELGWLNAGIAAVVAAGFLLLGRLGSRRSVALEPTWGCGYLAPTARMQYTARAVSELFTSSLLPSPLGPKLSVSAPSGLFPIPGNLASTTVDPLTRGVYEPFFRRWADRFARLRSLQQGYLHLYLVYILVTLLLALAWSTASSFGVAP